MKKDLKYIKGLMDELDKLTLISINPSKLKKLKLALMQPPDSNLSAIDKIEYSRLQQFALSKLNALKLQYVYSKPYSLQLTGNVATGSKYLGLAKQKLYHHRDRLCELGALENYRQHFKYTDALSKIGIVSDRDIIRIDGSSSNDYLIWLNVYKQFRYPKERTEEFTDKRYSKLHYAFGHIQVYKLSIKKGECDLIPFPYVITPQKTLEAGFSPLLTDTSKPAEACETLGRLDPLNDGDALFVFAKPEGQYIFPVDRSFSFLTKRVDNDTNSSYDNSETPDKSDSPDIDTGSYSHINHEQKFGFYKDIIEDMFYKKDENRIHHETWSKTISGSFVTLLDVSIKKNEIVYVDEFRIPSFIELLNIYKIFKFGFSPTLWYHLGYRGEGAFTTKKGKTIRGDFLRYFVIDKERDIYLIFYNIFKRNYNRINSYDASGTSEHVIGERYIYGYFVTYIAAFSVYTEFYFANDPSIPAENPPNIIVTPAYRNRLGRAVSGSEVSNEEIRGIYELDGIMSYKLNNNYQKITLSKLRMENSTLDKTEKTWSKPAFGNGLAAFNSVNSSTEYIDKNTFIHGFSAQIGKDFIVYTYAISKINVFKETSSGSRHTDPEEYVYTRVITGEEMPASSDISFSTNLISYTLASPVKRVIGIINISAKGLPVGYNKEFVFDAELNAPQITSISEVEDSVKTEIFGDYIFTVVAFNPFYTSPISNRYTFSVSPSSFTKLVQIEWTKVKGATGYLLLSCTGFSNRVIKTIMGENHTKTIINIENIPRMSTSDIPLDYFFNMDYNAINVAEIGIFEPNNKKQGG